MAHETEIDQDNERNPREAGGPPGASQRSVPGVRPSTVARYAGAVELYASTDMSVREICERCGVRYDGFLGYLHRHRRDLLLARHGVECSAEAAQHLKLHGGRGQTPAAHAKYRDAVAACDSEEYIDYNVSQIARLFGLDGTALGNQLRAHYPEIVERREKERRQRGIADNQHRGMRPWCRERYAGALELLRTTEVTVPEAAAACGVSVHGLSQHLQFYYKELLDKRFGIRERAKAVKKQGHITGNGRRHEPTAVAREEYAEAVRLYRETAMTVKEIAAATGKNENSLQGYLQYWHRDVAFARRGAVYAEGAGFSGTKQYKIATAAKYAKAIERLRTQDLRTAEVAAEFGLHPDVFRQYLKEHEPELYARQGMMKAPNGRLVSRRSMERYAEAIRLYETTGEDLRSIARRLGLVYNSLGGFVRRNFPELIVKHNALAAEDRD